LAKPVINSPSQEITKKKHQPKTYHHLRQVMGSRRNEAPLFSRLFLTDKSQFNFSGVSACTYACVELISYLFYNNIQAMGDEIYDHQGVLDNLLFNASIHASVNMEQHKSCDEVVKTVDRYKYMCALNKFEQGMVTDWSPMINLLRREFEELETSSFVNKFLNIQKFSACVLTKPPETIAVIYNPKSSMGSWYIFDSHRREYSGNSGSGILFFDNEKSLIAYLKQLFKPIPDADVMYNMFECHTLVCKGRQFLQVEEPIPVDIINLLLQRIEKLEQQQQRSSEIIASLEKKVNSSGNFWEAVLRYVKALLDLFRTNRNSSPC